MVLEKLQAGPINKTGSRWLTLPETPHIDIATSGVPEELTWSVL